VEQVLRGNSGWWRLAVAAWDDTEQPIAAKLSLVTPLRGIRHPAALRAALPSVEWHTKPGTIRIDRPDANDYSSSQLAVASPPVPLFPALLDYPCTSAPFDEKSLYVPVKNYLLKPTIGLTFLFLAGCATVGGGLIGAGIGSIAGDAEMGTAVGLTAGAVVDIFGR